MRKLTSYQKKLEAMGITTDKKVFRERVKRSLKEIGLTNYRLRITDRKGQDELCAFVYPKQSLGLRVQYYKGKSFFETVSYGHLMPSQRETAGAFFQEIVVRHNGIHKTQIEQGKLKKLCPSYKQIETAIDYFNGRK